MNYDRLTSAASTLWHAHCARPDEVYYDYYKYAVLWTIVAKRWPR